MICFFFLGIYVNPICTDNSFFADCHLVVKGKFCTHKYYGKFCCRSCTLAGQLPSVGPHLDALARRRRSLVIHWPAPTSTLTSMLPSVPATPQLPSPSYLLWFIPFKFSLFCWQVVLVYPDICVGIKMPHRNNIAS